MVKLEIVPKIIAKKLPYEGWVKMWDITCLFITLDQPFLYPQLILVSLWKRFLENMRGNRKCFAPSVKLSTQTSEVAGLKSVLSTEDTLLRNPRNFLKGSVSPDFLHP